MPVREADRLARKARRREDKRQHILAAAREVLRRDGYEAFTVSAVADRADMAKASLFYYFASREELLSELMLSLLDAEWEVLQRAVETAPSGIAALGALARAHVDFHRDDLASFRTLALAAELVPNPRALLEKSLYPGSARVNDALVARLEQDRKRGDLRRDADPRRLANVAFLCAHGLVALLASLESIGGRTRVPVRELMDEIESTLERAARPARARRSASR